MKHILFQLPESLCMKFIFVFMMWKFFCESFAIVDESRFQQYRQLILSEMHYYLDDNQYEKLLLGKNYVPVTVS